MGALIQKNFRILAFTLLILLASGIFVVVKNFSRVDAVLIDGADAVNMVGQYDDNFDPDYTSGAAPGETPNNYGFHDPHDLVVDEINHQLFVAEHFNRRVVVYDLDENNEPLDYIQDYVIGQANFNVSDQNNLPFDYPASVEVSSDGLYLFVGWNGDSSSVVVYSMPITENNPASLYNLSDLDGSACDIDHVDNVEDLEYAETSINKYLLVADENNNRVLVYEVSGMSDGLDPTYVLGQPNFITCDSDTSQTTLFGPSGVAYDTGATEILGDDRVFIADENNNRVMVYDFSLDLLASGRAADYVLGQTDFISNTAGSELNQLHLDNLQDNTTGIYFDKTNNRLFLADAFAPDNNRILVYDTEAVATGESATSVLNASPDGLYYNETRDVLYYTEYFDDRVMGVNLSDLSTAEVYGQINRETGGWMQKLGGTFNGTPNAWTFDEISFVTVDEVNHRLFVGDENNGPQVMVFDLNTQNELEDTVADNILGAEDLDEDNSPSGPTVAKLSDSVALRDAVYDSTSGYLYVADKYRIMVFDTATIDDGKDAIYVIGQGGELDINGLPASPAAGIFEVSSLAIDEDGRLFVADKLYNRVLVFDTSALGNSMIAETVLGVGDFVTNNTSFCTEVAIGNPVSLSYDATRHYLFVADDDFRCPRIMIYDVDTIVNGEAAVNVLGQTNLTASLPVTLDASHFTPAGIDYDAGQDRLFVTDASLSEHNRVLVFDLEDISDGEAAANVIGQSLFTTSLSDFEQNRLNDPVDVEYVSASRQAIVADTGAMRLMFFDAANAAPLAPTDLTVADSTAQSIQLTWTDNSTDETGFELYVRVYGSEDWTEVDLGVGVDQESYPVNDLDPSIHYEFQLRAYNGNGYSDYATADGSTLSVIPTAPTLISPDDEATGISLNPTFEFASAVDPDSSVIDYRLEFSDDESFSTTDKYFDQRTNTLGWSQINAYGSGDTASFTLPAGYYFAPGLTYYWRVRAYVLGLPSDAYSEVRSFIITDPAPTDLSDIPFEDTFITDAGLDLSNSITSFSDGSIKQSAVIGSFATTNQVAAAVAKSFDADADGDLDFAQCYGGDLESFKIMINDGTGNFALGYSGSTTCLDIAVGDMDVDGDLDVLLVHADGYVVAINDGTGIFSLTANASVDFGDSVDMGDIDKDGDLDFIVGYFNDDNGGESKIFLNDGVGSFSFMGDSPLVGINSVTDDVAIADFNGDTYLDFVIVNKGAVSNLYLNNKDASFSVVELSFSQIFSTSIAIVDFDNDGDLDCYEYGSLYFNDGVGGFTVDERDETPYINYTLNHGDFDADGDEDLLAADIMESNYYLYVNDGTGFFDETSASVYDGENFGAYTADVGDYNGDGVLDFHIPGSFASVIVLNTTDIYFEEETLSPDYYVVAVFDANNDGHQDLWQAGGDDNSRILLLNQGDGSYTEMAVEGSMAFVGVVYKAAATDFDNDGDLDVIEAVSGGKNSIFINDGLGGFALVPDGIGQGDYQTTYMRTGDIDNDGDYDVVFLSGEDTPVPNQVEVWFNDGLGNFTEEHNAFDGTTDATTSFDLGDVDGDGYLDLVLPLLVGEERPMFVYLNNGAGMFVGAEIESPIENLSNATLGDFDNDSDLDIFSDGHFFVNNGAGQFSLSFNYADMGRGPAESVDLDNDNDLDIIFITENVGDMRNYILRNQGNWSFVEEQSMFSAEDPTRIVAYGDYDSDGDMDFFTKNAENYGINYRYTQKQEFSTEVAGIVQSAVVATTDDDILSATLSVNGLTSAETSIDYYLSAGVEVPPDWISVAGLPEAELNGVDCFDEDDNSTCLLYGDAGSSYNSTDLTIWGDISDPLVGDIVDVSWPGMVTDSKIYLIDAGVVEVCTNLTVSGLRDIAVSGDYGYVVGEDGLIMKIDSSGEGSPVCSIIPALTSANLNAVVITEDNVYVYGDADEEGNITAITSDDGVSFTKEDLSAGVDMNDFVVNVEGNFGVYVGDNGTLWHQNIGEDPVVIESGTTENLTSVNCDSDGYCILVGENGTVLTSDDACETVTLQDVGVFVDILSGDLFESGESSSYVILTADNELYSLPVDVGVEYLWEGPVTPESKWTFENTGTSLLWKAELNAEDAAETSVLYDVSISYSTDDIIACTDCHLNPPTTPNRLEPTVVSPTSIQWNFADTSGVEYGFRLYDETPTLISDVGSANLSYIVETGLNPNTRYQRNVTAYNGDGESSSASLGPIYTYANTPSISGLVVTGNTSVALSINENSNPNTTKYAIYETSLGKWLQGDYKLGVNRIFKTYSEWLAGGSSIPITALTNNAMYDFKVQAQNGDDVETDFSASQSIVVYRPANANLVLSKKVGVNLAVPVAGVYLGQAVFAGTDTAQKIKIVPLIQRYTNVYTLIAGIMVLLFLMLLLLNAHPKAKHLKHIHKILFTDFVGNNGDLLFEFLHGKKAAKHGLIYRNHHRFYKLTNLGFMGFLFGLCMKVVVVCITAFLVYSTVQVQAFENQSGVDVKAGDRLTYQVEYLNNGGQTAHSVLVNEPIPSGSTYVAGSLTSTGSKCIYANNLISCNVGELASDAKGVLEFKANVTGSVGNTIIDIASVTYTEGTGTTNSNSTTNAIIGEVVTCASGQVCEVILGPGWNYFRMAVTAKVRFSHNNATHAVELTGSTLATKKGSLRVTSDPINVNLDEDEIKSVDSDGNTLNDLDLTIQTVVSDTISVVGIREAGEVVLPVCGDTQCNGTETCETCVGDCGVCPVVPVCGDNVCNGAETCNSCAGDCGICPVVPVCGDNVCNGAETCNSCSGDCGVCPVLPVCGDNICNGIETCTSCAGDCGVCPSIPVCGDNVCNGNETCNSCAGDCGICMIEIPDGGRNACSDNLDNDNDGKTDYPADPGCVSLTDSDETDEIVEVPIEIIVTTNTEDKAADIISTIVSGLTQKDFAEVKASVKQIMNATIDNVVVQEVNDIVQEPITIAATVASVASIATVGATGAAGVGLLTYLQFLFTQPLMILAKRKKHNWGVIYNSITKKPIDLAIIRLFEFDTNHLVTTRVTDKQGRYHFFVKPGKYYIEVSKKEHKFPSEVIPQLIGLHIAGGESAPIDENIVDGEYQNLYNGGIIEVKEGESGIINKAIPVDPDKKMETDKAIFKRLMWKKVQTLLTIIGPVLAIISFIVNPRVWVGALVVFQIIIYFVFRRLAKSHKPLTWGSVKDFLTGRELRKTVVRVFDTRFNKLLDTQVTDNKGKYGFLVSKGEYYLTGDKEGYENYKSNIFDLTQKEAAYLAEEIKMRKAQINKQVSNQTSNRVNNQTNKQLNKETINQVEQLQSEQIEASVELPAEVNSVRVSRDLHVPVEALAPVVEEKPVEAVPPSNIPIVSSGTRLTIAQIKHQLNNPVIQHHDSLKVEGTDKESYYDLDVLRKD
ncbi:MAG: hypothetical protein UT32_C0003G0015 [Parcubacteria group bacterium GW2011_GWC2_39_14]|nr:MAG: hypothetical protein UT32_C0003G0015 [Parcubacteria group bacterium GW2011_GWC2_39_14]KKR54964.1 MAG: hypothetical protein UT91_C0006G0015 [Parcubacteria group bacterium GW2011_GWA2_40_23]